MDVLVSGAGIAGPAFAWWLARRGIRPVVVERTPTLRVGGHAIDIRGAAVDVVEQMGLHAAIRDARTRIRTLSIVKASGRSAIDLDIPRARGETRDLEIVRDDLVHILYDATKADAEYVFGDEIASIGNEGPRPCVTFASGKSRTFDLIVGADGQHSATRRLVFGDEDRYARRVGVYLAIFRLPNILGLEDRAMLYNEPGRAVAYYTMAGNDDAKGLFLYRSREALDLRDDGALKTALRSQFRDTGWETRRLLEALDATPDFYFDEVAQIHMPSWARGHVVLLGDAAHGPSPLSGQGTSLALVGARLLAHALAGCAEPAHAFAAYERQMRPFVEKNQALVRDGARFLVPQSKVAIGLRNTALRLVPLLQQLGVGFGKKMETASRAVELPSAMR